MSKLSDFIDRFKRKKIPQNVVNFEGFDYDNYDKIIEYLKKVGVWESYYEELKKINKDHSKYYKSLVHGVEHTSRVVLYTLLLTTLDGISEHDKELLLIAARYHDIGRRDDSVNREHGEWGVKKIRELGLLDELAEDDKEIVEFVIKQHFLSKEENLKALKEISFWKRKKYEIILNYLKDADALDRVRIGNENMQLDPDRLRGETAKSLINLVHAIFKVFEWIEFDVEDDNSRKEKDARVYREDLDELIKDLKERGKFHFLYDALCQIMQDKDLYKKSNWVDGATRVTFFVSMLAIMDGLLESDRELLLIAARYHDIGRLDNSRSESHGSLSLEKLRNLKLLEALSEEDRDIVEFAIKQHSLSKEENLKALKKIPFWKRKRYNLILTYLKDAEILDNLSICENTQVSKCIALSFKDWQKNSDSLTIDSAKKLSEESNINYMRFSTLMLRIFLEKSPEFLAGYKVIGSHNISRILKRKGIENITEFIMRVEDCQRKGVLKNCKSNGIWIENIFNDSDLLYAISQIEEGDFEKIVSKGYNLSYYTFLRIISLYKPGTLNQLRTEERLIDLFSFDTFKTHGKSDAWNEGFEHEFFETLNMKIFDPLIKDTLKEDYMLYRQMFFEEKGWYNLLIYQAFFGVDIKRIKGTKILGKFNIGCKNMKMYNDCNLSIIDLIRFLPEDYDCVDFEWLKDIFTYEYSGVDVDTYNKDWQKAKECGMDISEQEFKEEYRVYKFIFDTRFRYEKIKRISNF